MFNLTSYIYLFYYYCSTAVLLDSLILPEAADENKSVFIPNSYNIFCEKHDKPNIR